MARSADSANQGESQLNGKDSKEGSRPTSATNATSGGFPAYTEDDRSENTETADDGAAASSCQCSAETSYGGNGAGDTFFSERDSGELCSESASVVFECNAADSRGLKSMSEVAPFIQQNSHLVNSNTKISTATSLVVESLLQDLCKVYIPDPEEAKQHYTRICNILYQMNFIDESYRMKEFEGMRNQYQRVFHHLLNTQKLGATIPAWPNNDITNEWSHYHREFDEIEYIAGGGFGSVYRVRHKLDGTEYAVKKIIIRAEGISSVKKYLTEVKTFAALNHSNIVQYKAAWLELGAPTSNKKAIVNGVTSLTTTSAEDSGSDGESADVLPGENIYPGVITSVESSVRQEHVADSSDFQINFELSCHQSYSNDNNSRRRARACRRVKRTSISEGNSTAKLTLCKLDDIRLQQKNYQQHQHNGEDPEHSRYQRSSAGKWATLYIQMALCPSTLQQWLVARNKIDAMSANMAAVVPLGSDLRQNTIMEIVKQLLKGLEYIHSKKIVHHDIKPSNIFIQMDNERLLVQLGDFGLACPLQSARHSIAGGTKLYAAPEQIAGKCMSKSDIYSLGIVTLELAESFKTDMERVENIRDLRARSQVSEHLAASQPKIATLINSLVMSQPNHRPDAAMLLQSISKACIRSSLANGVDQCADDSAVAVLKSEVARKDEEIARLRQLLQQAGVQDQDGKLAREEER